MILRKIWEFLWKSNSVLSWIVNIILIFLIVKFIIFPILSLIFATSIPFVIVESSSMHHNGNFDNWWESHGRWYLNNNITKQEILDYWPYKEGFNKGDIMIIYGRGKTYKKGEVIVFNVPSQKTPIIHRVVYTNGTYYSTKGDNNQDQIVEYKNLFGRIVKKGSFGAIKYKDETEIYPDEILGKAIGRIKYLGWVKLVFVELFNQI